MKINSSTIGKIITVLVMAIIVVGYIFVRKTIANVNTIDLRNFFSEGISTNAAQATENLAAELVNKLVCEKGGEIADVTQKSVKLYMNEVYVNKENCKDLANDLLADGFIEDMNEDDLAAEIYTHAFFYYLFDSIPDALHELPVLSKIYNSVSNGIDLENGGDTGLRQIVYAVIFRVF